MNSITIKILFATDFVRQINYMRLDCTENSSHAGIKLKAGQKLPSAEIIGKRVLALIAWNENDKIKIPLPKVKL